jgi:hypothetical protein
VPWTPPPGYENPVPEPGDARRRAIGDSTPKFVGLALVLIAIVGIYAASSHVDDAQETIKREIDKIQKETSNDTAQDSSEPAAPAHEGDADGRSNLPGGYATATFTPRGYMAESVYRSDTDSKFDGSSWQLTGVDNGNTSYAVMRYFHFVPPFTSGTQRSNFVLNSTSYDRSLAAHPPKIKHTKVDGLPAYEINYTRKDKGSNEQVIYVLGDPHSYQFQCSVSKEVSSFQQTCDELLDSLKLER